MASIPPTGRSASPATGPLFCRVILASQARRDSGRDPLGWVKRDGRALQESEESLLVGWLDIADDRAECSRESGRFTRSLIRSRSKGSPRGAHTLFSKAVLLGFANLPPSVVWLSSCPPPSVGFARFLVHDVSLPKAERPIPRRQRHPSTSVKRRAPWRR